jgi:hypothetical protein
MTHPIQSHHRGFAKTVALIAIVALLPGPLAFFLPELGQPASAREGTNPDPADLARFKAEYEEYTRQARLEGQERLSKILANMRQIGALSS